MRPAEGACRVSVGDIISRIGGRSIPAVILVPALVLVSPISGIPGTPTLGALIIILCTLQSFAGHRHLWLPSVLTRRNVSAEQMTKALDWLQKPAGWIDRHSHGRFRILTAGPFRLITYIVVLLLACSWPFMELLPFFTSFSASAVSLMMFGLMTRDGAYLVAGYMLAGLVYLTLLSVALGLV